MNLNVVRFLALAAVVVAMVLGIHLMQESKALSYLSSDPIECINCHVMESYYASWKNSSHAERATCVDCHLPADNSVDKYVSRRVQENCIRCHTSQARTIVKGSEGHYATGSGNLGDRKCWDCHRLVPHGKVRSLNGSPHNLAVKWKQ